MARKKIKHNNLANLDTNPHSYLHTLASLVTQPNHCGRGVNIPGAVLQMVERALVPLDKVAVVIAVDANACQTHGAFDLNLANNENETNNNTNNKNKNNKNKD